ncbi:MAG: PorP/SprF family type IX secretion system membrane protein [Bacteroidales bacterium]|nr:PorP/SprF family type IX secretion system membrane protein [Bacteroidales bacterium]
MNPFKTIIYTEALLIVMLMLPFNVLRAQQEPQFAHNMFNNIYYNPGFVGSVGGICATGLVRQQWAGFKDDLGNSVAPNTYSISVHSPVNILHGGVGLNIYSDNLGFTNEIGVKLMYAYRVDIGMGNLGIGLQLDFMNSTIDFATLRENAIDQDDILLQGGDESDMVLDFGFGVQYFVPEKFYVGLSSTRILESQSEKLYYTYKRHYFLTGGYEFAFPNNPSFVIKPSIVVKSDMVETQFDAAALLEYNNKVWGGVSYSAVKNVDPFSVLLGLKIKDIRVGYAYTIPTSKIGSTGGHEVMIGYCFKIDLDKGRRSYKNTRFL